MSIRLKYANLINIDQVKLVNVDVDKVFLFGGQRFTTDEFALLGNKSTRITARTMRLSIHSATFEVQSGGSSYSIEVPSFALDHAYHYVPGKIIGDFDFKKYFEKKGQNGWEAVVALEKNLSGGLEEYYVDFANPKIKPSPDEEIDISKPWWSSRRHHEHERLEQISLCLCAM